MAVLDKQAADGDLVEIEDGVISPEPMSRTNTVRQLPSYLWVELLEKHSFGTLF